MANQITWAEEYFEILKKWLINLSQGFLKAKRWESHIKVWKKHI